MVFPIVHEIAFQEPLEVFQKFANQAGSIFLDSAQLMPNCARYSFIALDPFLLWQGADEADPLTALQQKIKEYPLVTIENMPPFQGGVAGFFSYELANTLEKLPEPKNTEALYPVFTLGFYDLVIAFDLVLRRAWIFSSGYPHKNNEMRMSYAKIRLHGLLDQLSLNKNPVYSEMEISSVQTNFTSDEYQQAVSKVKEYILAGDIFEANLAQRFEARITGNPLQLYRCLRQINPAPFSAYLNFDCVIVSASPERFLKVSNHHVETRPIKGTSRRSDSLEEDKKLALTLKTSEKDISENVMIVDLLRNDLSRVCVDDSVLVTQLCKLETYATVHHLVSVVEGDLQEDADIIDLLRVTFPGGSITGAPKIRAMEIIHEIEKHPRGPYCGSIGYMGFDGSMDTSITIRTLVVRNDKVTFHAGGAIVADSDPLTEYEETLTKAYALLHTLQTVVDYDSVN